MRNLLSNLPANIEAEKSVISSIISEPECLDDIKSILQPEHFFVAKHSVLYKAILELHKQDKPIDQISLFEKLKADDSLSNAGGPTYLGKLVESYSSAANVNFQSTLIFEKYLQRQFIIKCQNFINRTGKTEDIFDLISEAEKEIGNINNEFNFAADSEKPLSDRIDEIFDDLEQRIKGEKQVQSLKLRTLPTLNRIIGGIMPTDLIGIYGKEKSTKTSLAHEIALDIGADQGHGVAIFTFENLKNETDWKSISMRTGIEFNKLRNPNGYDYNSRMTLEEAQILRGEAKQKFGKAKIVVCDQILNEYQIANKLRLWKKKHGIKLCVIDYLMLVDSIEKFPNRREELNHLSRFFKQQSMKLEIPIILISQSNEAGERAAEAKGLERDSNYFIYVRAGEKGERVQFNVAGYGSYEYILGDHEFIATVRGIRHTAGNKSFITKFQNNRYVEVDARPPALKNDPKQTENWYERKTEFPI